MVARRSRKDKDKHNFLQRIIVLDFVSASSGGFDHPWGPRSMFGRTRCLEAKGSRSMRCRPLEAYTQGQCTRC